MDYLPLFVNLKREPCLVVGAGDIAARKIELLARAGGLITVISRQFSPAVLQIQHRYALVLLQKSFTADDVRGFKLVVSATDDPETNELVANSAKAQHILVNVVDNPALCSFIFPSIIDRSPLIAAVSSSGVAPVLARLLRAKIESLVPPSYGRLAQLAEKFRRTVQQHLATPTQRRIFWEQVFQGRIAEAVFAGNESHAEAELQQLLTETMRGTAKRDTGEVYLIGAGPGAADLLTFRALRLLQQADVVVYDHLVSTDVLDLARRDAEKIYVGKQRSKHTLAQEDINTLLIRLAQAGRRVARVKGGDPFIFGRGGEEIETLAAQHIPFQVVPGITAASGCAAYAGIPLTHRDYAQSCTFVTGHLKNDTVHLNWTQLAAPNQTIVVYMGSMGLEKICQALIAHGSPPDLPIALIEQGTTAQQRVIIGTLSTLAASVAEQPVTPPTLIIIGTVVSLHERLHWFQSPKH